MMLASLSDQAKHNTTLAALGTSAASWLIDHTSLFTALTALLTGLWLIFCMIERGQRIYFNWRYGPNGKAGADNG
jgi:hypothetical protein